MVFSSSPGCLFLPWGLLPAHGVGGKSPPVLRVVLVFFHYLANITLIYPFFPIYFRNRVHFRGLLLCLNPRADRVVFLGGGDAVDECRGRRFRHFPIARIFPRRDITVFGAFATILE